METVRNGDNDYLNALLFNLTSKMPSGIVGNPVSVAQDPVTKLQSILRKYGIDESIEDIMEDYFTEDGKVDIDFLKEKFPQGIMDIDSFARDIKQKNFMKKSAVLRTLVDKHPMMDVESKWIQLQ